MNWTTLSIDQRIAFVGILVTLLVGFIRWLSYRADRALADRRHRADLELAKKRAEHEGKALLRQAQLKIAERLFDCIGNLVEPKGKKAFNENWYKLSDIYYGSVHLLIQDDTASQDLKKGLKEFTKVYWEYDEYDDWTKVMVDESGGTKEWVKLEQKALELSHLLNNYIRKQFDLGDEILYGEDGKGASSKRGISKE